MNEETYERLSRTDLYREVRDELKGEEPIFFNEAINKYAFKLINGKCAMLDENKLCRIHTLLGFNEKPIGCRFFPLVPFLTPDGIYLGVSFFCPAIRDNVGEPIEKSIAHIKPLLEKLDKKITDFDPILIAEGVKTNWAGYKYFEKLIFNNIEKNKELDSAIWQAIVVAANVALKFSGKKETVTAQEIGAFIESPALPNIPRDELFQQIELFTSLAIIALIEETKESNPQNDTAVLLKGEPMYFTTFGNKLDVSRLYEMAGNFPSQWKVDIFKKFIIHFIWRKSLIIQDALFSGLCMLLLGLQIMDFYFYASALNRGAEAPEPEDAKFAMWIGEKILGHSLQLNVMFGEFARSVMRQIKELRA